MEPATATTATDRIFRTVPESVIPASGPPVIYVEIDGQPRWLIREGTSLEDALAEMDRIGTHLVRHGLWAAQDGGDHTPPPALRRAS